ncbi:hypothetical protein GGI15_001758 [Coemansia interrupta]|uniref:Uncharacterized protein n=1 Tax=Coemansia interrupta TaxID=1126814 RepID=A0A9W8LKW4_9FUNG|nr:hypothetical protein GGI15_001758 [Coemansia interrupta]
MTSPTSSKKLPNTSPPRRSRTRAAKSNPYGTGDTPQPPRASQVKWNPDLLIAEMAKNKDPPLSEETGDFLVQDDCFSDYRDDASIASIDSDDPTNTAMFLDESEERELEEVLPGTPMAFSKLGQVTVQSIRRQRISQTPGRTPRITGTSAGNPLSARSKSERGSSSSKKHYVDDMGSPSKKGKQAPVESLESLMPPLQLNYSQSRPMPKAASASKIPQSVEVMNKGRRATLLLEKIKNGPLTTGIPSPPKDADVAQQRKRTPIKPHFERNDLEPIVFSRLMTTANRGSASSSPVAVGSKQQTPDIPTPSLIPRASPVKAADAVSAGSTTGNSTAAALTNMGGNSNPMHTPQKKPADNGALIDLRTPRTEQRKRMDSMMRFFGMDNSQTPPKFVYETPKAKRTPRTKTEAASIVCETLSDHAASGMLTSSLENLAQLSPIHTPAKKGNIIDTISFAQSDDEHGSTSGLESMDLAATPMLLLSFASQNNDGDQRDDTSALQRVPFDLGQEYDRPSHDSLNESSCADLIDMASRLSQSVVALNSGMHGQLLGVASIDAGELTTVTEAVERANAGPVRSLGDGGCCISPSQSGSYESQDSNTEFHDQVRLLRDTMAETKEMVSAIRCELDSQREEHSSERSKIDNVARLLGALDMRLHMVEGQQRQINKTQSSATSSGSTKVPKPAESPSQVQMPRKDAVSSIGQTVAHCLNTYPLFVVGALFIVLVSELIFISGIGGRAFGEFKRYIPMPPQQPS